ncbi:response regulator transcription factor [Paraliobacillus ryukyuensis]|nr:response regulator transcription factor [Paraliobacillus ryukyuensis]
MITIDILFIKKSSLLQNSIMELLKKKWQSRIIALNDGKALDDNLYLCDLVIIDVALECPDLSLTKHCLARNKKVVAWVDQPDHKLLPKLFEMGLNGYFYNGMEEEELLHALYIIQLGKRYINPTLANNLLDEYVRIQNWQPSRPDDILSKREWEVLQLLSKGYNNFDIASTLYLSDKTVKNYVSSILKKLNVPDRTNAVLKALKQQWLHI